MTHAELVSTLHRMAAASPDLASLELATAHLNAPYGDLVRVDDLVAVLAAGTTDVVASKPEVASILGTLFVELPPAMVGRCMTAAGASFESVQALYAESVRQCGRIPAWERSVAHLG